jgi:predicted NBD/HSP70 family sugar kinase
MTGNANALTPAVGDGGNRPLNRALLSPTEVGRVNRSVVLQALCDHGPLSRADLAKMAGVTRATIGNIVNALLEGGLVEEWAPEQAPGRAGKPARPLWFAPRAALSAAVVIGFGSVEVALVDARGELLDVAAGAFDAGGNATTIARAVGKTLAAVVPKSEPVLGIGVAVPGVCDTASGEVVVSAQTPNLVGSTLSRSMARRFGVPVYVDNDARAQALGEKWFGLGRGVPTFASVQTGHGLGIGLVLGGALYRGDRGATGELGHTAVVPDGERCRCGLRGCWETIATLRWLREEAARRQLRGASRMDARLLVMQAASSEAAAGLMADYAENIAVGLANVTNLLNPKLIIVHGDVPGGGQALRGLIEEATRRRVLPYLREVVEVALSPLEQRAGLLGAAGLVLSATFGLAT